MVLFDKAETQARKPQSLPTTDNKAVLGQLISIELAKQTGVIVQDEVTYFETVSAADGIPPCNIQKREPQALESAKPTRDIYSRISGIVNCINGPLVVLRPTYLPPGFVLEKGGEEINPRITTGTGFTIKYVNESSSLEIHESNLFSSELGMGRQQERIPLRSGTATAFPPDPNYQGEPTMLEFGESGAQYILYGNGLSLEELVKVANSMQPVETGGIKRGFAPAGDEMAFIRNGDVFVGDPTGQVRNLTNSGSVCAMDARDDGLILFATHRTTDIDEVTYTIETIKADGSSRREVKKWLGQSDHEPIASISISPEENLAVYTLMAHQLSQYYSSIQLIDLDTGQESALTEIDFVGTEWDCYCYASFSPSGDKLACIHAHSDSLSVSTVNTALMLMHKDGSGCKDIYIIGNPESRAECPPSWSPDGSKLSFIGADGQIWTVNASGTEPKKITDIQLDCSFPDWSPDGKTIAFCTTSGYYPSYDDLYVVDADSGDMETLTGYTNDAQPRWITGGE